MIMYDKKNHDSLLEDAWEIARESMDFSVTGKEFHTDEVLISAKNKIYQIDKSDFYNSAEYLMRKEYYSDPKRLASDSCTAFINKELQTHGIWVHF